MKNDFAKYIAPDPIDKLDQPAEKVFNGWSFVLGIIMTVSIWLWWAVFTKVIF